MDGVDAPGPCDCRGTWSPRKPSNVHPGKWFEPNIPFMVSTQRKHAIAHSSDHFRFGLVLSLGDALLGTMAGLRPAPVVEVGLAAIWAPRLLARKGLERHSNSELRKRSAASPTLDSCPLALREILCSQPGIADASFSQPATDWDSESSLGA